MAGPEHIATLEICVCLAASKKAFMLDEQDPACSDAHKTFFSVSSDLCSSTALQVASRKSSVDRVCDCLLLHFEDEQTCAHGLFTLSLNLAWAVHIK